MNKTMKKVYETPFTTHVRVEMESQLCTGSSKVTNPDNANGRIDEHSINDGFGGDFSGSTWDTDPTKPAQSSNWFHSGISSVKYYNEI